MPHHERITVTGRVTHVFAHRFVFEADGKSFLADLTPDGAKHAHLSPGSKVTLSGDMRPSEIKVDTIAVDDGAPVVVGKRDHDDHAPGDPAVAEAAAQRLGYSILGRARRKPKHFEVLGRDGAGALFELHIELDGSLRKTRPVEATDAKWAADITHS